MVNTAAGFINMSTLPSHVLAAKQTCSQISAVHDGWPLYQQSMPKGEQSNDKVRKLQILLLVVVYWHHIVYANRLLARKKKHSKPEATYHPTTFFSLFMKLVSSLWLRL